MKKTNNAKLKAALDNYRQGLISIDKAAKIVGLTVTEIMAKASSHGIKSGETLEEYRKGVRMLTEL